MSRRDSDSENDQEGDWSWWQTGAVAAGAVAAVGGLGYLLMKGAQSTSDAPRPSAQRDGRERKGFLSSLQDALQAATNTSHINMESTVSRADVPARPAISNLNSLLADIHVRYIALKREDFQLHYRVFDEVFRKLNENMKAVDKYYERYASNIQFAGSHYDRLRIVKPDEFDMDIVIGLPVNMDTDPLHPEHSDICIEKNRPEYVRLRAGTQYRNLSIRDPQDYAINRTALEWLDNKNFILGSKFIEWFRSVGERGLGQFQKVNGRPVCYVDGVAYTMHSSSSGPAWTVHIVADGFNLDFDLVPALKFPESRWLPKYRKIPAECRREYWLVVPKPNPDAPETAHELQRSWRVAVQDQEKQMLENTHQMRQIIRLLKKFRDAQEMDKIASYYIKTLFFWEMDQLKAKNKKKREAFWQQNNIELFKIMLQRLYDALDQGSIPYFWKGGKNYIKRWDTSTLNEYKSKVNDLLNVLKHPNDYKSVAKYLLTAKEYEEYKQFL